MHPALSIVLFTTLSGAGYSLLTLLALLAAARHHPEGPGFAIAGCALAMALILGGLAASTRHLTHPERAWRAVSQWRSSWLSREAVAALVTFLPAGVFILAWIGFGELRGIWAFSAVLTALGAVATVVCTGQIYASLRTIPQWHHPLVTPLYLGFGFATGMLWLNAVTWSFGVGPPFAPGLALLLLVAVWGSKAFYWRRIDAADAPGSPGTATGLGPGAIRSLDPPHSQPNYVMREMGFRIGRKHSAKLRRLALVVGLVLPAAATTALHAIDGPLAVSAAWLGAVVGMAGVMIERWLFFAEARHVVMNYYRPEAA